jgi:hypothetical protein
MRIRLHAIPSVLAGVIVFPWSEAESMLNGFAEFARSAPEELGVTTCLIPAPDGSPSVMLAANWCGRLEQGEAAMASLEGLGTPLFAHVAPMTYAEMLHRFDDHVANGRHYAVQTRWLPNLTPEILTKCTAAMVQRTSTLSAIIWHHFRGAATRVPPESTAFGLRKEHFMMEIVAAWEPSSRREGEVHRQWARSLSQSLAPFSLLGGYPNMLSPEDLDQIPFAYGDNDSRLQSLKKRFDPDGIFTSAVPLSIGALA